MPPPYKRPTTMKKYVVQQILKRAGFETWMITRQRPDTYAMLLIACNRLCPTYPKRAFMMLDAHLRGTKRSNKVDITKWRCAEKESKEGLRLMALKLQNQDKNYDLCPVCGKHWQVTSTDEAGNVEYNAIPGDKFVGYADIEATIPTDRPTVTYKERLKALIATKLATKQAKQAQKMHVTNVEVKK